MLDARIGCWVVLVAAAGCTDEEVGALPVSTGEGVALAGSAVLEHDRAGDPVAWLSFQVEAVDGVLVDRAGQVPFTGSPLRGSGGCFSGEFEFAGIAIPRGCIGMGGTAVLDGDGELTVLGTAAAWGHVLELRIVSTVSSEAEPGHRLEVELTIDLDPPLSLEPAQILGVEREGASYFLFLPDFWYFMLGPEELAADILNGEVEVDPDDPYGTGGSPVIGVHICTALGCSVPGAFDFIDSGGDDAATTVPLLGAFASPEGRAGVGPGGTGRGGALGLRPGRGHSIL